jgi:hypothetical protein
MTINMKNMYTVTSQGHTATLSICGIWYTICRICYLICRICKKYVKQYAEYAKKYVKPFAVCRIVTGSDFAYSAYVCTPHFADVSASAMMLQLQVASDLEVRIQA